MYLFDLIVTDGWADATGLEQGEETVHLFISPLTTSTVDARDYLVLDFGMGKAFQNMVSTDRLLSPVSQKPLKALLNFPGTLFPRRTLTACSTSTSHNTPKDTRWPGLQVVADQRRLVVTTTNTAAPS